MPPEPTHVGGVVVNYNARPYLLECLRSLRAEGVRHVVVVDNGSTDGSAAAVAEADPEAVFVPTGRNLGYGTAVNRGVPLLPEDVDAVLVSNADVVVEPGTVKALVAALEADPRRTLVGPRIENPDGSLYPSARAFPSLLDALGHGFLGLVLPRNRFSRRYKMLDWDHAAAAEVDWISGASFLARRHAFEELGGFDERYFMYLEDVDLCWRTQRAGWEVVYEPAGRVVHAQGVSTDQRPYRMIVAHHRSMWRFAGQTATGWRRAALPFVALALVARCILSLAKRAFR